MGQGAMIVKILSSVFRTGDNENINITQSQTQAAKQKEQDIYQNKGFFGQGFKIDLAHGGGE